MSIQKIITTRFKTSDGKEFASECEAKKHEVDAKYEAKKREVNAITLLKLRSVLGPTNDASCLLTSILTNEDMVRAILLSYHKQLPKRAKQEAEDVRRELREAA